MGKKGPKRIAGVKVPKRIRKPLGKAGKVLQNPIMADLIAAALLAAAAALRDSKTVHTAARKAKDRAGDAAQGLGSGVASIGAAVAAKAIEQAKNVAEAYQEAGGTKGSKSARSKDSAGRQAKTNKKKSGSKEQ